ncbi:MAG: ornithine cyclodeaminase family protein [Maribacter sp.]|nr:ornithine cyclodeaminase family protein [Maribacter sp.]
MHDLVQIDDTFINGNTSFPELISKLKDGFASRDIIVPMRHHHDFPNPQVGLDSTLLLMPAWNTGKEAGVKIVTVSPENSRFELPSIQGVYILMNTFNGSVKAIVQAKGLTAKRTAAASALASSFLSRKNASSLLMVGTGALASNLIKAHAGVRPIKTVYVWGRNFDKAKDICNALKAEDFEIKAVETIEEKIKEVDIISCATLSKEPLILGKQLKPGQHIDLVGAYKKDMREADDEAISRALVFVDTMQGGLKESGDIVIPLQKGILTKEDIKSDLFGLCSGGHTGRTNQNQITVFKSVGHALEDLVAATYYYNKYTSG